MKKAVLGLMLIVGALSFATDAEGRGEGNFVNNLYKYNQVESSNENLSRGTKQSINKDFVKNFLRERGSSSDRD